MKLKECFTCKRKFPLFMFSKSNTPPIKHAQGRTYVCRLCTFRASKDSVVRKQPNGSFKVVKLTLKERIKELFE